MYLIDPLAQGSAEFKVRMYVEYICQKHTELGDAGKSVAEVIQPHMRLYFRYVVKWLLEADSFCIIKYFNKHFEKVKQVCPELVPQMAGLLQLIGAFDMETGVSEDKLGLQEMGLGPEHINMLTTCKFYKGFEHERTQILYKKAFSGNNLPTAERLTLIESLMQKELTLEQQECLKFAKTIIVTTNARLKAKYLLEGAGLFKLLSEWFPSDPDQCYSVVLMGAKFKDMPAADFLKAIVRLAKVQGVEDSFRNGVVKSLFALFKKLQGLSHGEPWWTSFGAALFSDLAV